jgi:hypothetical protein
VGTTGDGPTVTSSFPRWIPIRRATRRRIARVLKMLVCAVLVFGLMPGAEELVESAAHLLHDGHLRHSEAHDEVAASEDCDSDCKEHGCTALAHHCKCCASASALAPRTPATDRLPRVASQTRYRSVSERGPPNAGVKPFLRPPIA